MSTSTKAAIVAPMQIETRGQAIARRMNQLGMNYTSLGEEAGGIYRQTVKRATEDDDATKESTYAQLEAALDRIEQETGQNGPGISQSTEVGLIEFEVTGDFGVRVVVKGPIADADALERSVARLIRDMRPQPGDRDGRD